MSKTGLVRNPYNFVGAFLAFSHGTPEAEICSTFSIPPATLREAMRKQKWVEMAKNLPLAIPEVGGNEGKAKLSLVLKNRENNLKMAEKLREDALSVIDDLLDGRQGKTRPDGSPAGTVKRYWHNRGMIIEKDVPMGLQDRVALANYVTMIQNLTYRALGDKAAAEGGASDRAVDTPAPPSITIVLPGAIGAPRNQREEKTLGAGQVVDLNESFGGAPRETQTTDAETDGPGHKALE